jgi:hypothetical protein
MVFTREYLRRKIKHAIGNSDGVQAICITLKAAFPSREFIMSYNPQKREVMGIIEKLGRTAKRRIKLSDILR